MSLTRQSQTPVRVLGADRLGLDKGLRCYFHNQNYIIFASIRNKDPNRSESSLSGLRWINGKNGTSIISTGRGSAIFTEQARGA